MKQPDLYTYDFKLPGVTPMLNVYDRMHWSKKPQLVKDYAWMIKKAIGVDKNRVPLEKCLLFIERHAAENPIKTQTWDWDGLLEG